MNMDRQQFWRLLKPIHPKAESFCRKLTGNRDKGDDLYQSSILKALRKIKSLKKIEAFPRWFFRIIINNHKNQIRAPLWRERIKILQAMEVMNPQNDYDAKRWLEKALNVLSADEKALVVFYEIEGWKISELSDIFKKPEGTIKARLARSRRKMRKVFEFER
ncbi:MAG: RNA polymerase sigma factor [Candidatus Zixiibacteriota bacterium]